MITTPGATTRLPPPPKVVAALLLPLLLLLAAAGDKEDDGSGEGGDDDDRYEAGRVGRTAAAAEKSAGVRQIGHCHPMVSMQRRRHAGCMLRRKSHLH